MEKGLHDHRASAAAASGLPPGIVEDWGSDSVFLPASESALYAESNDKDKAAADRIPDTQVSAALVLRPADAAMLDSRHAAPPASPGSELAAEHHLTAQVLHQGASTGQLPTVSLAVAGAIGKEQGPAELAGGASAAALFPDMSTKASPAGVISDHPDSRDLCQSDTELELSQAEQGLPVPSAAASTVSAEGTSARVLSMPQAAESAAVLTPPELQLGQQASSAVSSGDGVETSQAASSVALLAPGDAAGGIEGAPAAAARTRALLAPSKAQLKRARRAAFLQRSAQGTPQAAGRKRAWQDWLAHKPGRLAACPGFSTAHACAVTVSGSLWGPSKDACSISHAARHGSCCVHAGE